MSSLSKKTIENYFKEHLSEDMLIFKSDKPITNSINCTDYEINGVIVRAKHFSPHHKGDKSGVLYHPLTPQQIDSKKAIKARIENDKKEEIKKIEERKARNKRLFELRYGN